MISKTDIEKFEAQLREDKEKVLKEIKDLETPTDFGDAPDGGDEESDEDEELENRGTEAEKIRGRLADIEDALNKIKTGEYGICDECGRSIELEVLEAAPESNLCKEDKQARL